MNEKLITGYTAFTTADEFGTAAVAEAEAPGTGPLCGILVLSILAHC